MEYKKIDELTISDCCELLDIGIELLPEVVSKLNGNQKLIDRLQSLLLQERTAFAACETITQYEDFISQWPDGLYHDNAVQAIKDLKSATAELAYYRANKDSLSGLESYLKRYPQGQYFKEAKTLLHDKRRTRKMRNRISLIVFFSIVIVVCLMNYSPVSFIGSPEEMSFGKLGGTENLRISTDARYENVDVTISQDGDDWITLDRNDSSLNVIVAKNPISQRTALIKINAYSSFFGYKFGCLSREITVSQDSGLPTFLNNNISEVVFDKYGYSSSNIIIAQTDGCDLKVSSDSWFDVSHTIEVDGDNIVAKITLTAETNNGSDKTGELIISCANFKRRVKVSQVSGLATRFIVARTSIILPEKGIGEGFCYPVDVDTDGTSWSVHSAPDWLIAYADLKERRLEVKVEPNMGKKQTGIITLKSNNGDLRDISVIQQGDPTNFSARQDLIKFGISSDYEYVKINNDSHKSLSVSENEDWISVSVIDKNEIKISCSRNYDDPPKSGVVVVRCGSEEDTITVRQDGWEKCDACGGDGEVPCPNQYKTGWGTFSDWYTYEWVNGQHWLIHNYFYGTKQMKDSQLCRECGGDGKAGCEKCDSKGKIVKSY